MSFFPHKRPTSQKTSPWHDTLEFSIIATIDISVFCIKLHLNSRRHWPHVDLAHVLLPWQGWQSYLGVPDIGTMADAMSGHCLVYGSVELRLRHHHLLLTHLWMRQNGCHLADNIFKSIFLSENVWIFTKISLKFVPKDPINNISSLVQTMAWGRLDDKPLSEPIMISLLMYICVTRPQWVNSLAPGRFKWNLRKGKF